MRLNNSLLPTCHTEVLLRITCNYTYSADQVSGCKWNYQTVESKLSEAQQFLVTHLLQCHLAHLVSSSVITSDHIWSTLVIIRSDHQVPELYLVVRSDRITAYHLQLVIIRSYLTELLMRSHKSNINISHRPFISQ